MVACVQSLTYNLRRPMPRLRTILAFLIAPFAIPIGFAILCAAFPGSDPVSFTDFLGLVLLFSYIALPPAYLFELVIGLPVWLFFCRRGTRQWYVFAAGGAMLGTLYWVVFTTIAVAAKLRGYDIYAHSFTRDWFNPMNPLFDVPAGFMSAVTFRAIIFPWRSQHAPRPSAV